MERVQPVQRTEADQGASPPEPAPASHCADSRRERKKQETRQRLLERAWKLFQDKGYEQTTVEDITEAADVAKSTFFNYFETKEAMLGEISVWRIQVLGNQVLAAHDVPDSAMARIKLVLKAMLHEFSPDRELTHHLFLARIGAPMPMRRESAHRLGSIVQELVTQGQARQEIRADVEAGLITRLLMTCFFHNLIHYHHPDGPGQHAPLPPEPATSPEASALETRPLEARVLEARVLESVDALMDGLGGPKWRVS